MVAFHFQAKSYTYFVGIGFLGQLSKLGIPPECFWRFFPENGKQLDQMV
jgi:hypothetical protein